MYNLVVFYVEGVGSQLDYGVVVKWFEQVVNFGVKDSLFNLGIFYVGGIGVDKDLVVSYKWFVIVVDQGDQEVVKWWDDVVNMMDQEMLVNVWLVVEGFKL